MRIASLFAIPRWIILFIDCTIILFCCALMFFARMYFFDSGVLPYYQYEKWIIIFGVFLMMEYFTKNYTYIIRLSIVEDLYRVFIMNGIATGILVVLNFIFRLIAGSWLFNFWTIIFLGCLIMTLMLLERLSIKYVYSKYLYSNSLRRNVFILGNNFNSVFFANALRNEYNGSYTPVAFLSLNAKDNYSTLNGIPVIQYNPDNIKEMVDKYDAQTVVFFPNQIEFIKNGIADNLMSNNVKMMKLNLMDNVLDEDLTDDDPNIKNISTLIKSIQIEDLLGREPIKLDKRDVKETICDSVVMVTGAAGSIGSEIVRQVAAYGARHIVLLDQAETPMHDMYLELKSKYPNAPVTMFIGDVQNRDRVEEVFKRFRPEYVFHAAAYKHVPMMELNPTEAILTNVMGTKNVADLSLKYKAKKFVMISTDKAVNPTNVMGTTKRIAEVYVQSLFFDSIARGETTQYITTRFGNVLGSNGSVIPLFHRQIENGGPVTVTHRDIIRYFMTIPEACSLVLEAGCMGKGGEIYVFDMGDPVKIYDLATKMITLAGLRPGIDIQIKETGLRPGEKLYEELLNDKERTTSTQNKKIMICEVPVYNYDNTCRSIAAIIELAKDGNIHDMVTAMKRFIPEYKSNNSEFEKIDHEIEADKTTMTDAQVVTTTSDYRS